MKSTPSVDGIPTKVLEPKDDLEKAVVEAETMFRQLIACSAHSEDNYIAWDEREYMEGWLEKYGRAKDSGGTG